MIFAVTDKGTTGLSFFQTDELSTLFAQEKRRLSRFTFMRWVRVWHVGDPWSLSAEVTSFRSRRMQMLQVQMRWARTGLGLISGRGFNDVCTVNLQAIHHAAWVSWWTRSGLLQGKLSCWQWMVQRVYHYAKITMGSNEMKAMEWIWAFTSLFIYNFCIFFKTY